MCSRTILAFWASLRPTRSGLHHAAADAARWRDGAFIPGSFTDKMLLERRSNSISFCVDQTWRNKDSLGPAQFPVLCSVVVGSFIWGGGGMADSVQPTQRNLYQKGVTGTYRDGTYGWCTGSGHGERAASRTCGASRERRAGRTCRVYTTCTVTRVGLKYVARMQCTTTTPFP